MSSLKFFKDKSKLFECDLEISGTTEDKVKPRLIFNFNSLPYDIIVEGKIINNKCHIDVPAFKNLDSGGGEVKLEIIAENMVFDNSWKSNFLLENSLKVVVENVKVNEEEPKKLSESTIKITPIIKEDKIIELTKQDIKQIKEHYLKLDKKTKDKIVLFESSEEIKKIVDKALGNKISKKAKRVFEYYLENSYAIKK